MPYRYSSMLIYLLIFLFYSNSYGQLHYHADFDGIPIVAVYTNLQQEQFNNKVYESLRRLGAAGAFAYLPKDSVYEQYLNNGLRVIPCDRWVTGDGVYYYAESVYSSFETEEDTDSSNGVMRVLYDNTLGKIFTEGDVKGVVSNNLKSGAIIYGPGYYQDVKYQYMPIDTADTYIKYKANFRMKINILSELPNGYLDSLVCKIQVTAADAYKLPPAPEKIIIEKLLRVRDFISPDSLIWDIWQEKELNYDLSVLDYTAEYEAYPPLTRRVSADGFSSKWMQYKVIWQGRSFLNLYIDKIEVSDAKARDLINTNEPKKQIKDYLIKYS